MRIGRKIVCLYMFIAVCFFLTGCQRAKEETDSIVLTFSWWGDENVHQATLEAIEEYERLHPEIDIRAEFWNEKSYYQRISTQLANDEAPDIFQFQYTWYGRATQGAMTGLKDLSELGVDFEGVEALLNEYCTVDDKVILYPLAYSGYCLIINCDFFDKYGISWEETFTWKRLLEEGTRVRERKATDYLLQVSVDEINQIFLPAHLVQQSGENVLSENGKLQFDSQQLTATLETIAHLYETGTIAKSSEEILITGAVEESKKWEIGKIGIRLGDIHTYVQIKEKMDFPVVALPLPRIESADCSGVSYQPLMGLSINEHTLYPGEAANFLQWFTSSEEAAEIMKLARGIPANEKQRQYMIEQGVIDEDILEIERMIKTDSYVMNDKSCDTEFVAFCKDAVISVILGELEPRSAAMQIMSEWVNLW